jgi:hypothetical protein
MSWKMFIAATVNTTLILSTMVLRSAFHLASGGPNRCWKTFLPRLSTASRQPFLSTLLGQEPGLRLVQLASRRRAMGKGEDSTGAHYREKRTRQCRAGSPETIVICIGTGSCSSRRILSAAAGRQKTSGLSKLLGRRDSPDGESAGGCMPVCPRARFPAD